MKKIFKGLAITVAATAACAGIAVATAGCSTGKNGKYEGDYHYTNEYGATYGMKVRVTVENNIITKVEDITKGAYTEVSPGWEDYFAEQINYGWLYWTTESKDDAGNYVIKAGETPVHGGGYVEAGKKYFAYAEKDAKGNLQRNGEYYEWDNKTLPEPINTGVYSYGWTNAAASVWTKNESYLLQKYVGKTVTEILDIKVFIKETGEPYEKDLNTGFNDVLVSGSTQSCGRLLLAIQDALGKKTEIGRIIED